MVIKISDDSSSDSDMGLDSELSSSPESLLETDDVIFVDHTFGCAGEDRGEQGQLGRGALGAAGTPSAWGQPCDPGWILSWACEVDPRSPAVISEREGSALCAPSPSRKGRTEGNSLCAQD